MFEMDRTPLRRAAPIVFWLAVANAVVYAFTAFGDPSAIFGAWGLVPARFLADLGLAELTTVLTSMFLHGGLLHLAGNLIFLIVFGRLAEERLGSRRFLGLYLLAGLAAALAQIAIDPRSVVPMVGASGAISGALGAAVVLAPRKRIVLVTPFTLFIPVTLSVWAFGVGWLAIQVLGGLGAEASNIAFWAHVGGFVAGWWRTRLVRSERPAPRPPAGFGPAPRPGFRTFSVTDARGRTYVFHEPIPRA